VSIRWGNLRERIAGVNKIRRLTCGTAVCVAPQDHLSAIRRADTCRLVGGACPSRQAPEVMSPLRNKAKDQRILSAALWCDECKSAALDESGRQ
jgi:hypothetical protein